MEPATEIAHLAFPSDDRLESSHQNSSTGPLSGVRVLDLTRVLSGPHAGRMLCDLGAEVIKVEPPAGDLTRFSNPRVGGMASYFVQQNVGKRNISLDMNKPEGVQLLLDLIAKSDVVIENFRPGVMDRMGLGYAAASAVNNRIVYASINGYGSTGPWRRRRAYATVVGADTGFTKAQGDAHGGDDGAEYVNDPHSHGDVYTGMEAVAGILAALFQREHTGRGQRVEVTMAQTLLYVNEHAHDHLWDGEVSPEWIRSFQPGDYPTLTVANGETVMVSGHPAERGTFDRFIAAMQRPDLLDDPRFDSVASRLTNLTALVIEIRKWAVTLPDPDAVEAALDPHGLAVGTLRSVRDIAASEWAVERGAIVEVPDRSGGKIRVPNSPWEFSESSTGVSGEPKFRGEDNEAVLREVLGLAPEAVAQLDSDGVLSSRLPNR
ncbi:MAG: CoA transferase [Ilumatobacteraceae bacterium]